MGKTAILAIRIIGDATDAVASLDKVDGSAKSMESTMNKASAASGVALAGLTAAAWAAGNAASEAQQAAGAVESVFGGLAERIKESAAAADETVGLSTAAYSNMASVIGSQLKNMGLSMDETGDKTEWMIGLGADLSATFGGTTADAVGALSSLLRGERDPIERYGVSIKEADVAARASAMGLEDLYKAGDRNASLQATLSLLTEQTADAQGQFSREADTAAGQQQRANAMWENAAATLGEQLLPIMTEGAKILGDLAQWTGQNTELATGLAVAIGVLAAGILTINGAMKVYAAIQAVQTAAQWANNAAWLASPITWIVLAVVVAIAAVIAIIVLLVQNWDTVAATAAIVWQGVIDWIKQVGDWFGAIFSAIGDWWADLVNSWISGITGFISMIRDALNWLGRLVNGAVPGWLKDMLGMSGRSASFAVTTPDPTPVAARMLFTAEETTAGFAQPTAYRTTVGPAPSDAGFFGSNTPRGGDTYNLDVHFDGLVTDPEAVAREIRKILDDSDKTNGRKVAVTTGGPR